MLEAPKQRLWMAGRLGILWCTLMHNTPMWPIRGNYRCRTCGRDYQVSWEGERAA
jgi:hypothetical protein